MELKQENFVVSVENFSSPVIITVPHGGISRRYGSWLGSFFKKRPDSVPDDKDHITKGDAYIWHIAADILKKYPANAVMGLMPRCYIDYNRFYPSIIFSDQKLRFFYQAYHKTIEKIIERLLEKKKKVVLLDFHGFSRQPVDGKFFDIILGTDDGESTPLKTDKFIYRAMKKKYQIFCSGQDGLPEESIYRGNTTNLYYSHRYGIDGVLVEISPRFRKKSLESQRVGMELADDFSIVLNQLHKK